MPQNPDSKYPSGLPRTTTVNLGSSPTDGGFVEQAKEKAGQVLEGAKSTASAVAGEARQQVTQQVNARKDRAVDALGNVASALRDTGERLEGDAPGVPQLLSMAAGQFDTVQQFLQDNDLRDMGRRVESFARREPALFLGGAFVLGLAAARFLKSSAPESSHSTSGGYRSAPLPSFPPPASRYDTIQDEPRQARRGDTAPQRTYAGPPPVPPPRQVMQAPRPASTPPPAFTGYGGAQPTPDTSSYGVSGSAQNSAQNGAGTTAPGSGPGPVQNNGMGNGVANTQRGRFPS